MCDVPLEKLCGAFCQCEPVAETNVVDCRCDEHADGFERVKSHAQPATAKVDKEFEKAYRSVVDYRWTTIKQIARLVWHARAKLNTPSLQSLQVSEASLIPPHPANQHEYHARDEQTGCHIRKCLLNEQSTQAERKPAHSQWNTNDENRLFKRFIHGFNLL